MKSQLRDLKEELEELRLTVTEKTEQLQEYRVKVVLGCTSNGLCGPTGVSFSIPGKTNLSNEFL